MAANSLARPSTPTTKTQDAGLAGKDKILTEAMNRFKQVEDAENDIRNKGLECQKFRVGEQWPMNVKQTRAIESRPCLTFNQMPQFIRQVTNDARMNRPAVKISPVNDSDEETAEVYEGLIRHIHVGSNADVAFDTAMDSAVAIGWGYFRLITEYCNDKSFDQEIRIKRIKNAFSVYYDPSCMEPDYSDAKFCFVVEDIQRDEFKKQNPDKYSGDIAYSSIGDSVPDWQRDDFIRVAEYFTVEEADDSLCMMVDGSTMLKSDMAEGGYDSAKAQGFIKQERPTTRRKVMWRKITAWDILEEKEWPGRYIPIIPVLGEDLDVDGKRHLTGMVYNAMDSQRQYNYMRTAQTEAIALAPKAPFIAAAGQIENYDQIWQTANVNTYSVLPYNPIDVNGAPVPPPQRQQAEPPVQAMIQASAEAAQDMKSTTGIYSAGLGKREGDASGVALKSLQKEGDVSNFHYIDNLSRAIRFLGVQEVDLIPKIYDAARVVRILHEDGTSKMVKVNQPSGEQGIDKQGQAIEKIYDLTTGEYDIVVEVGPSYTTKRQETAENMTQMAQAYPPLMQIAGDLLVKNLDWPGANDVAERLKMSLPPNIQQAIAAEDKSPLPPVVQQQMAQSQDMIKQLADTVHSLQDQLDTKAQEIASKERVAAQKNETDIAIAAMKEESAANSAMFQHGLDSIMAKLNSSLGVDSQLTIAHNMPAPEPSSPTSTA